ncbi:MAG: hypothetical protein JOZ25_02295, partial [Actinobacteria bacterium]|nr:hypothetical protein [Actinomycetota bacterium]
MTTAAVLGGAAAALAVSGLVTLVGPRRPRGERGPAAIRLAVALGDRLRRRLGARAPAGLEDRIAAAAAPARLGVREVMAAKVGGAVLGS